MINKAVKKVDIGAEESLVDLKGKMKENAGFKVSKIDDEEEVKIGFKKFDHLDPVIDSLAEKISRNVNAQPVTQSSFEPKELVKVKFAKFVQLVASRDFFSVLERNKEEDIVMSSNLLTELAGAIDQKGERKTPVIFLIGLAIGVVVTYILISK